MIVDKVWEKKKVVLCNLGGSRGGLALACCWLISLASVANNTFHLWLATTFNGGIKITGDTLQFLSPGMRDIFQLIKQNTATIYVHEPLPSLKIGLISFNIIFVNQHQQTPLSSNFKDTIAGWYRDLHLSGDHSNDSAGIKNHLFGDYGLYPSKEHA
jgi:hypothetical protein